MHDPMPEILRSWQMPFWFVPCFTQLPVQHVNKAMQNGPLQRPSSSFRVRVRAAVPDSEEGQEWKAGKLPVPVFQR